MSSNSKSIIYIWRAKIIQPRGTIMPKKSLKLQAKLDNLFANDPVTEEFGSILNSSLSRGRFDNQGQLNNYLCEGALLNINAIASKALSIPSGEYMVWVTDVGHTMLVPTEDKQTEGEVFEGLQSQYEVLTPSLLQHWSKIERVLAEEQEPPPPSDSSDDETAGENPIQSRVNPADIDRSPMLRAMEDSNFTVSSLAHAAGVQPPAISRLLRTPKDRQGDPGGRNPSMGLAAKISELLRMDPTALFPDIFGAGQQDLEARDTPGNRGSGMKGAASGSQRQGAATNKWTQGAS
jgi:transcriptional regulator with XRE-family HTH domain